MASLQFSERATSSYLKIKRLTELLPKNSVWFAWKITVVEVVTFHCQTKINTSQIQQTFKKNYISSQVNWPRQTDREQTDHEAMISLHVFVTDFVAVISSQSEGLGKMALGIVKIYLGLLFPANRRCSRSVRSRSVGSRSVCRGQLSWIPIFSTTRRSDCPVGRVVTRS